MPYRKINNIRDFMLPDNDVFLIRVRFLDHQSVMPKLNYQFNIDCKNNKLCKEATEIGFAKVSFNPGNVQSLRKKCRQPFFKATYPSASLRGSRWWQSGSENYRKPFGRLLVPPPEAIANAGRAALGVSAQEPQPDVDSLLAGGYLPVGLMMPAVRSD